MRVMTQRVDTTQEPKLWWSAGVRDMMLSTMALEDVLDGGHGSFETTLVAQLFLNRAA